MRSELIPKITAGRFFVSVTGINVSSGWTSPTFGLYSMPK